MKGLLFTLSLLLVATAALAGSNYLPTDAERARWTMSDMQSWRIVLEAYKQDHGTYPKAASLEELRPMVEPVYIRHAPMTDAWGHPYRYAPDAGGTPRLISAGADGKFDEASWATGGRMDSYDADAVMTPPARWMFRSWEFK